MKRFIAFLCALILVCSIAAVTVAACNHGGQQLLYWTTVKNYTKPYWTQCANNPYTHAHTRKYRDKVYVYYCPTCNKAYEKNVTEFLGETCPCR